MGARSVKDIDALMNTQVSDENLTNRDYLYFHYFNPNGAYAAKRKTDARISALIDEKRLPFGWCLAYGSLNDYSERRMAKMLRLKSPPKWIDISILVRRLRTEDIRINKLIDDELAKEVAGC